jgi:hypothetical protein
MSLSRRSFTKEFKEAAVRRLELGASIAEVARACEVLAAVSEGATVAGPRGPQRRWLMAANRCAGRLDQPPAQEFTAGRREGHSCVGADKPRPQCGGKPLWARQRSAKLR